MKRTTTFIFAFDNFFAMLSQNVADEAIISKNEKGIVSAVEFSNVVDRAKIPSSQNEFFEHYLKVTFNDVFQKASHQLKRKNIVHDHFYHFY